MVAPRATRRTVPTHVLADNLLPWGGTDEPGDFRDFQGRESKHNLS